VKRCPRHCAYLFPAFASLSYPQIRRIDPKFINARDSWPLPGEFMIRYERASAISVAFMAYMPIIGCRGAVGVKNRDITGRNNGKRIQENYSELLLTCQL
jgi:hypothetical protein